MKSRRFRNYTKPERKAMPVLRFSRPLTLAQVRQIESSWIAKGGATPISFEFDLPRKPWWRRWLP